VAALAGSAASALVFRARGVLALRTALANAADLVEPLPDVLNLKLVKPLGSQVGNDMQPGEQLIFLVGFGCKIWLNYLFQPVIQELLNAWNIGRYRSSARLLAELEPCPLRLVVRLALNVLPVALTGRVGTPHVSPVAVLDRVDGALAIVASAHAAFPSITFWMYSSIHSGKIRRLPPSFTD
jgi:hypothetical protein